MFNETNSDAWLYDNKYVIQGHHNKNNKNRLIDINLHKNRPLMNVKDLLCQFQVETVNLRYFI